MNFNASDSVQVTGIFLTRPFLPTNTQYESSANLLYIVTMVLLCAADGCIGVRLFFGHYITCDYAE